MERWTIWIVGLALLLGVLACGGNDDDDDVLLVSVSGDAIPFNVGADARVEGAVISILEFPERSMRTGADGHFQFDDLPEGSQVTLVLDHPDYHPIQTGTHTLGPEGLERLTFQAVTNTIYNALAAYLGMLNDPDEQTTCQMVTTVTRVGKSLYDEGAHGEGGVTVTLEPPLPAENGPIYFNSSVMPEPGLTQTSDDGGVLFIRVPPGEYHWEAHKSGMEFRPVEMKCRAGFLVNASPPWGLQALP